MEIEFLTFRIDDSSKLDEYLQLDKEIWDSFLIKHPSFHSKEIWLEEKESGVIRFVVKWKDSSWKSIDEKIIQQLDDEFKKRFSGKFEFVSQQFFRSTK